jgi:magnesium chelatase subunit I
MKYTRRDLFMIAELTGSYEIDGHRADLVILKAARALAAFEGRDAIQDIDIFRAAELALLHRVKRGPFSDTTLDVSNLEERMSDIAQNADWESDADSQSNNTENGQESEKKKTLKR